MKKYITFLLSLLLVSNLYAEEKSDSVVLKEVSVTALYRNSINTGSIIPKSVLIQENHGQGPDYIFSKLPGIYAYNDNGLHMGYTYFRIRGMGQERINVTLDGMPWNEAEDFGCYFSNSPDLLSSMHSVKVEKGASITNNGTAAYAGNVSLESIDLREDTISYVDIGGGSFGSSRISAVYNIGVKKGWGFHLRATQQQTDGYKENCYNNSQSLATKIGYFWESGHSLDFLGMVGYHRNGQGFMGLPDSELPTHPSPIHQSASGNRQQETDDFLTAHCKIQYKGKLSEKVFISSSLYWQHQTGNYRISFSESILNNYHLKYDMIGGNAVIKYYPTSKLSMSSGINAYTFTRDHDGRFLPGDTIIRKWRDKGVYKPYYINTGKKPDLNVFYSLSYSPGDRIKLTGNIQYRHTSLNYITHLKATPEDLDYKKSWDFINYGVSVEYELSKKSKLYTRFSVTNREPSRTDLFGGEYRSSESEMNTDPERVYDIEAGYEIREERIKANVNLYYMSFRDELVATGELSPMNFLPLHKQYDSYRLGLEIATEYNPVDKFWIIFNYSLGKNRIKNLGTHTFSPSQTIYGELNYTIGKTKFGVTSGYRSWMWMDVENKFKLPELFTLGGYVNSRVNKTIELGLNLENITNRRNLSNGSVSSGEAYYLIDSPFTFFVTCKLYL